MGVTGKNYFKLILLFLGTFILSTIYAQDDFYGGIKTVVIDPGHGGHDHGCSGSSSKEKDIALAISLKLGKFIQQNYPDIELIYTRKTDVFVELGERAQIANRNKADLFICIHANAAGAHAIGAETFVLGLHRTEAQQQIAERENSAIHLEEDGGEKYKDFDLSIDAIIARQLQLSVFLDHSIAFAARVQGEMERIGRVNRGVKQAGFLVLYKTTMPSVLIETGFLTNKEEEAFLKDTANQSLMAQSFYNAFESYKVYYEEGYTFTEENNANTGEVKLPEEKPMLDYGLMNDDLSDKEVVFRVQIATNASQLELTDPQFKNQPVWEYQDNDFYKYTVGAFKTFDNANELKKTLREMGFENAFLVAFKKNERINLEKAVKFAEKQQ